MKWQAKKEDFQENGGWIEEDLASSHPVKMALKFNLFSKESFFFVTKAGIHEIRKDFDNFEDALEYFNSLV